MWLCFLRSIALYMYIYLFMLETSNIFSTSHHFFILLWLIMTGPCLCFPPAPGNWQWVHWSWFGPKHILNNTLSVSLSISSLLCQYLWSWGGNTGRRRCQTRRRRRTSPPSWSRRVTGRSWRRRWEMILGFFYPSWTHSRWKLAVKLVSFHCADSRHLFDFLLSVSPKIYTDYNTPSWSRGWRRAAGRTRWRGSARTLWRSAVSIRSLSRTWSR